MRSQGLDESGDGGLCGFYCGGVTQVAEGLRGNGADGGEGDRGGKGDAGSFEESNEVASGGGAGKGDGVRVVFG